MSKRTSAPPKRLRVGTGTLRHAYLLIAGLALATNVVKAQNWVPNTGSIPFDAIAAGYEPVGIVGRPGVGIPLPLYVCRSGANEGMGIQVGNFGAGSGCTIGYGGSQQSVTNFDFLVSDWQQASSGFIPPNALEGGWDDNHKPLYYCRANIAGSDLEPGKIGAGYGGCSIPYGGSERVATSYQVLIGPPASALPLAKVTASGGSVPLDAILAGTDDDGTGLFLCTASDGVGFLPGKLRPSFKGCDVSYGGGEHVVTGGYVVLVAKWAKFAPPPPFLSFDFTAGFDVGGQPLYACRAYSNGGVYPGKMQQTWSACDFGWGGTEQWGSTFDILSSTH